MLHAFDTNIPVASSWVLRNDYLFTIWKEGEPTGLSGAFRVRIAAAFAASE